MDATPWDTITPENEVYRGGTVTVENASQVFEEQPAPTGGGSLTIPLICLGIGLIAMCVLIPAADENHRLSYERERLRIDLEQLQKQVATNDAFLKRVADDPTLSERLARRQMKMVPEGSAVLDLKTMHARVATSPFLLVSVPPPAPLKPYRPIGGFLADACRHPRTQLYLIGIGLMTIAVGVVLGRDAAPA